VASRQTPDPAIWARTPRQAPSPDAHVLGRWSPTRPSHITAGQRHLGAALHDGSRPADAAEGGVERLLLAFEELVSHAVRHGRSPIEVLVTATGSCWLLEVTDAAEGTPRSRTRSKTPRSAAWASVSSPGSAVPRLGAARRRTHGGVGAGRLSLARKRHSPRTDPPRQASRAPSWAGTGSSSPTLRKPALT
jgi:hypothetical protein